jgi:hypothetical protein
MTTSFELVHHCQPNYQSTLYPIFSHGYFRRVIDRSQYRLQFKPQSLSGMAIGHSKLTNGLMFRNPTTTRISVSADYRLNHLGHLPPPFNIKFDGCKPLTTYTDIAEPFLPGTSVFIQYKGVFTHAMVMSLHIDSSNTSDEYHYYTDNLVTGSNRQIVISEARYTAANSALKHNDTDNGIMSLPLWFLHIKKIML